MVGKRLPRELRFRINHLANERAKMTSTTSYRAAYLKEKARLLGKVVTWLAVGKTVEDALEKLRNRRSETISKKIRAVRAMLKQVMETP